MDLSQKKLSRSEWESIENPIQANELNILKLIHRGYNEMNIIENDNQSLVQHMKMTGTNEIHAFLFNKYFKDMIQGVIKKYKKVLKKMSIPLYSVPKYTLKVSIKAADKIRIEHMDIKLKTIFHSIFEYRLIHIAINLMNQWIHEVEQMEKNTKNKIEMYKNYYTLIHLKKVHILYVNPYVLEFIDYLITHISPLISNKYIVYHSDYIIEQNQILNQYIDRQLFSHQKELFSILKREYSATSDVHPCVNDHPKLIFYQAPTGTGKTVSPIGIVNDYRVIFVCAAKHVGLQLAKSCVSLEIPIAVAFGCSSPGDIRLHYYAAKDVVRNYKTGGIYRVDNSVGDKVQLIVCDVESYLPAMNYLLAFEEKENIVTYWDEPTISLDYEEHEFHSTLQKNWRENVIPNMVLSSATLPSKNELSSMIRFFNIRFPGAKQYTVISHDCAKTIPILDVSGAIAMPHLVCSTKSELVDCVEHCNQYKTILRHFDLKEIIQFCKLVDQWLKPNENENENENATKLDAKMRMRNKKLDRIRMKYDMDHYFENVNDIVSTTIKYYYLELLKSMASVWDDTFVKDVIEPLHKNAMVSPRLKSTTRIVAEDAHTLTDGPTIYLANNITYLCKILLKMSGVPFKMLQRVKERIDHNEGLKSMIYEIEKDMKEYMDKQLGNGKDKDTTSKTEERKLMSDPEVRKWNDQIQMLSGQLKNVNLDKSYIPNKPEHLERFGISKDTMNAVYKRAFTSDIDESTVESIMMTSADPMWKMLLLLGIGVFSDQSDNSGIHDVSYLEIMKKLAQEQRLYLIIASSDYIYGTNYQFCHGYIGKDMVDGMTQEKVLQSFGRVGRNSTQKDYSVRVRDNVFIKKVFFREVDKRESKKMNVLFGIQPTDNQELTVSLLYGEDRKKYEEEKKKKMMVENMKKNERNIEQKSKKNDLDEPQTTFECEDEGDWEDEADAMMNKLQNSKNSHTATVTATDECEEYDDWEMEADNE